MDEWLTDEMKDICKNNDIQPISNAEASFLMFDIYKKKIEMQGVNNKNIDPVFNDFLKYFELFPHTKNHIDGNIMNELHFSQKKTNIKAIRATINEYTELYDIERAYIWNLLPQSIEESVTLIPSLARFIEDGKESILQELIDKIKEFSDESI